jgi:RNA-binding protein YlmH
MHLFVNGDSVSGNFMFETASHGDFLGSILGTGVTRDKVGDVITQVSLSHGVSKIVKLYPALVSFVGGAPWGCWCLL